MTTRWRISIRSKILLVLSAVVIAAVALYLYLASRIFYEDKTLLIYELNQTNVRTLGADTESNLKRLIEKLRWVAVSPQILASISEKDEDFVRIGKYRKNPDGSVSHEVLGTWFTDAAYLDSLRQKVPVPFAEVAEKKTWVRNATPAPQNGEDNPPLMTIATLVERSDGGDEVYYGDVKLDPILQAFSHGGVAKAYLVDSDGFNLVARSEDLSKDPLVRTALSSKIRSEVKRVEENGQAYLGAFFRTSISGVTVVSKIELEEAFAAARVLVRKSVLYASIVVTAAFLVALFFSHSLTAPILRMVEATRRIAQGDFNLLVPISSRDELAMLAVSFNSMTEGLKTSRHQIEEYSRDLEKKVAERTVKLEAQNVAIKEAQEALVRTTRLASVGEIAGRAAHEVLNPLTSITSRLEKMRNQNSAQEKSDLDLLRQITDAWLKDFREKGEKGLLEALLAPSTALPGKTLLEEDLMNLVAIAKDSKGRTEQKNGDVEFLLKESARINKIVNGMRQLSRLSASRRAIDVREFLTEALATMADLLGKHGIKTETQLADRSPQIVADHDELLQVMSNLIRNSMQAIDEMRARGTSPEGGPRVWLKMQTANGRVEIRICDNGPGIPAENSERIFEPTFTTKSSEEGTGLGLSICRRFIRALDGEITLEKSIPGVETVFLIDLPEMPQNGDGGLDGK